MRFAQDNRQVVVVVLFKVVKRNLRARFFRLFDQFEQNF